MLETMLNTFVEKMSNNVVLLLLTGLTVTTSGVAGAKLYTEYTSPPVTEAMQVEVASPEVMGTEDARDTIAAATSDSSSGSTDFSTSTVTTTDTDTSTLLDSFVIADAGVKPEKSPSGVTGSSTTEASCIVTIFGKNYDVQSLRSTHPGGDVFKCDTDMSTMYQKAHGSSVSMLSAYETQAALGTSNSQGSTSGSQASTSFRHEEEREDEEYEEEWENQYEEHDDHEDHDEEDDHGGHDEDHESEHHYED